jgi:hypothetical protein
MEQDLLTAFNAGGLDVASQGDATVAALYSRAKYTAIKLDTLIAGGETASGPITSLSSHSGLPSQVHTTGGILITSIDDGRTNSGGNLKLTNLTVDMSRQQLLADVVGGNGLGLRGRGGCGAPPEEGLMEGRRAPACLPKVFGFSSISSREKT